jgi:hypothetical protein
MGYMRHHAIIVTGWNEEALKEVHSEASKIFPKISNIVEGTINGYSSFLIPPDGSKEGWEESKEGDERRSKFISWLITSKGYLRWVEVQYGDEDGDNRIIQTDEEHLLVEDEEK